MKNVRKGWLAWHHQYWRIRSLRKYCEENGVEHNVFPWPQPGIPKTQNAIDHHWRAGQFLKSGKVEQAIQHMDIVEEMISERLNYLESKNLFYFPDGW